MPLSEAIDFFSPLHSEKKYIYRLAIHSTHSFLSFKFSILLNLIQHLYW